MKGSVERVNAMLDKLQPLAAEHQVSIAQLVIAWTLMQPGITCVLCGARDPAQAAENAAAGAVALQPEEINFIQEAVHGCTSTPRLSPSGNRGTSRLVWEPSKVP